MGGHDGQPIPKLVGHLLHLLGDATESRSLAISSLCLYNWEYKCEWAVLGSSKQAILNFRDLTKSLRFCFTTASVSILWIIHLNT